METNASNPTVSELIAAKKRQRRQEFYPAARRQSYHSEMADAINRVVNDRFGLDT